MMCLRVDKDQALHDLERRAQLGLGDFDSHRKRFFDVVYMSNDDDFLEIVLNRLNSLCEPFLAGGVL